MVFSFRESICPCSLCQLPPCVLTEGQVKLFPAHLGGTGTPWGCGDTADNKKINECPSQASLSAQSCFPLLYLGIPPANSSLSQHWISSALLCPHLCEPPPHLFPLPQIWDLQPISYWSEQSTNYSCQLNPYPVISSSIPVAQGAAESRFPLSGKEL